MASGIPEKCFVSFDYLVLCVCLVGSLSLLSAMIYEKMSRLCSGIRLSRLGIRTDADLLLLPTSDLVDGQPTF